MAFEGEYNPEPWLYRLPKLSHYYGDNVRQLLLAAGAVMLFAAPFYADDLQVQLPFILFGVVVLICVAALTTPRKESVMRADTVAAGVGLVIFEWWALVSYNETSLLAFALREVIAALFFFSLYYSAKTLRAMQLHQIGARDTSYDARVESVLEAPPEDRAEIVVPKTEAMEEANDRAKHEYQ